MMNSGMFIFGVLKTLQSTTSTKEKAAILAQQSHNELFLKTMEWAYNPFKNYGVSHVDPQQSEGSLCLSHDAVWRLLEQLSTRRLTGCQAKGAIHMTLNNLDQESAEVLRCIIHKDMRAGFGETLINKAFPKLLPEFPYMRCTLPKKSNMSKWNWSTGIYVQLKADGMFANVNKDEQGFVWVTSRNGSLFPDNCLDADFSNLTKGTQTHGELTVYCNDELLPRKTGNGILNSLLQGGKLPDGHKVVYDAWDQIPLFRVTPKGRYMAAYQQRFQDLESQLSDEYSTRLIESTMVFSKAEAYALSNTWMKQGLEGAICKHPNLIWQDTGSSGHPDQVKLKLEFQVELRVVGLNPGKPGKKTADTFGSLQCRSEDGLLEVGVSGLTDADRARGDAWISSIVTVTANDIMVPDGGVNPLHSLFLPRLEEERLDKRVADTLEQILAAKEAAINTGEAV